MAVRSVVRHYDGAPRPVLDGLDLIVEEAERVAIVGRSGAGKSTLLNLLGLLDRPDSGDYRLDGREFARATDRQRAIARGTVLGFVFQQFHLVASASAVENVELGLAYAGVRRRRRRSAATAALAQVGLAECAGQRTSTLSGGQQQRVAIARALCRRPAILLCDEPTGNLDHDTGASVLDVLTGLAQDGVAVVVITHDPAVAARLDRTMRLDGGRLAAAGSPCAPSP